MNHFEIFKSKCNHPLQNFQIVQYSENSQYRPTDAHIRNWHFILYCTTLLNINIAKGKIFKIIVSLLFITEPSQTSKRCIGHYHIVTYLLFEITNNGA